MYNIYFDNSATTKMDEDVLSTIYDLNKDLYANPSAMHKLGFLVEEKVKQANEDMAKILGCENSEIIWTSGGSESNNLAIRGFVDAHKKEGNHIITTKIEHASVLKVFEQLDKEGFQVTYLDVDNEGHIDIEDLKNVIKENTIFISIMFVNNEIGSIQNIKEIGNLIKTINPKIVFHTDFVQGFGKYKIDVQKYNVDMLSISSHKFYGPKGVGVLYKNKNIRILPLILGGGQQNNLRSGTLNVSGIIGTQVAAKKIYSNLNKEVDKLLELRKTVIDDLNNLNKKYGIIFINTKDDDSFAPHIVSVSFKGIRAEVMLHALEEKGIYVSAGSACSSHNKKNSITLLNIGLPKDIVESTIRLSFGKYNEIEEIKEFIAVLDELLKRLILKKQAI